MDWHFGPLSLANSYLIWNVSFVTLNPHISLFVQSFQFYKCHHLAYNPQFIKTRNYGIPTYKNPSSHKYIYVYIYIY
jgi:hypothetical protein